MFLGICGTNSALSDWGTPGALARALAPYVTHEALQYWQSDACLLLDVPTQTGAQGSPIYHEPDSPIRVLLWGRLDNVDALAKQLQLVQGTTDCACIAAAWKAWSTDCVVHIEGDFAFAVVNTQDGTVFLARDRAGAKPLFYRNDANGLVFANSVSAFKALKLGSLVPSRKWMAEYLLDMSWSITDTAFESVFKLPPAHTLLMTADRQVEINRYHQFKLDSEPTDKHDEHWLAAYKALWSKAVSVRIPDQKALACENSGGLDSASITAEVAQQLGGGIDRLHALGFCYHRQEPEYIMATAMQWRIKHNILFSHSQAKVWPQMQRREFEVNGYPMEHGNGSAHLPLYEYCQKNGIGVLLSGFGGDEVCTNPGGMPARFECIENNDWLGLWRILQGAPPMKFLRLLKTLKHYQMRPKHSPRLLKSWNLRLKHSFLSESAMQQFDLKRRYAATARYDENFRSINAFAFDMLSRPYSAVRLENCSLMAASYGIEYAWPLLDEKLQQQWFATPSNWKVGRGGIGRYLHRRAVVGVCPDKVVWKPSKDMGYSDYADAINALDNREFFRKAITLLDHLPEELSELIDGKKMRAMAEQGLREDWRGADINYAWSTGVCRLEALCKWLEFLKQ